MRTHKRLFPWTPTHGPINWRTRETYVYELYMDTECRRENLPRVMTDRNG